MNIPRVAAALCALVVSSPAILSADAVLEWNAIMVGVVAEQPPPDMNRFAAITQLAVLEAVDARTTGRNRRSPTCPPHRTPASGS